MYCSSCGSAVGRDLSYCNHCGAKLSGAKGDSVAKPAEPIPDSLVWAIVSVFVVGLGCMIGLMAVMEDYRFNQGMTIGFTFLIFLLMLAVEGVFISLLLSRKRSVRERSETGRLNGRLKEQATKELGAVPAQALPEPAASVTEHTTRAFEPIYSERKGD